MSGGAAVPAAQGPAFGTLMQGRGMGVQSDGDLQLDAPAGGPGNGGWLRLRAR